MHSKINVLLADKSILFSEGLQVLLEKETSFNYFVKQVNREDDLLINLRNEEPHILIFDSEFFSEENLPLEKVRDVIHPQSMILISYTKSCTSMNDICNNEGINGFLSKSTDYKAFHSQLSAYSRELADLKLKHTHSTVQHMDSVIGSLKKITKREQEVINLLCQGLTTREIADRLFLSFNTVKQHRKNIFSKLNISRVHDLKNINNSRSFSLKK